MKRSLVWFRKDLRTHDNPTLRNAIQESDELIPLYVFDPSSFGEGMFSLDKIGGHRVDFLWESVSDLRSNIRDAGGSLVVRCGKSEEVIQEICRRHSIDKVYMQTIPSKQEMEKERKVKNLSDISFETYWTHTLYHIDDLNTYYNNIDDTFTPWRKDTQYNIDVRPTVKKPEEIDTLQGIDEGEIPDVSDFKLSRKSTPEKCFVNFKGGESKGIERIQDYIWDRDKLREYKKSRNKLLGEDYSSKFSPWLAHGCVSPRHIYEEIKEYEEKRVSNDSTYWLIFELMWRDFFQFQFMKHGDNFFNQNGIRDVHHNWNQNLEMFNAWSSGKTGIPFVDANMRELNKTGYMSNRGRQNVSSFLTDVLGVDWRMGAMYFQSKLVDYDVCSNWGNWAYQAGVGNDSRDKYFNVVKQGEKYDQNGEYIRYWIPEIKKLPAGATHKPWLLSDGQQQMYSVQLGIDYEKPIVDIQNHSYKELVEMNQNTL